MSDWIDNEKLRRDQGINRGLLQSDHAAVNARYPGCTLEYCCECDQPTGNAGKGEDSNYTDDEGPYCWDCLSLFKLNIGDSKWQTRQLE